MNKPILWHQGLFLQPQHLQLNDLFFDSKFEPYFKFISPESYGVYRLEIKEAALPNYSFQIVKGEFWFNDMTYAVIDENAVIEPRYFKDIWENENRSIKVYIGLKKMNESGSNTGEERVGLSDVNSRFVKEKRSVEVKDLHLGGAPSRVEKMTYLLKIFFDTEIDQLGNYELIPIAEIERRNDEIKLSNDYIPPCLSIDSSKVLLEEVKEIYNHLLFRGRELESHKKRRGVHNAEFGSRDMVYLLALRSFNRYIPVFSHILEGGNTHPWNIYLILRQLIGELSSFSDNVDVLGQVEPAQDSMQEYDHLNLGRSFRSASLIIENLIREITAGPEYEIPLIFDEEDKNYSADLKYEHFAGNKYYYLVVKSLEEDKKIIDAIDIEVKVGSKKSMPVLVEKSLPGVEMEHLPVPPQELPRRSSTFYFRLDCFGEEWIKIKEENQICLFWESAPEDVEIEMMIVGRK